MLRRREQFALFLVAHRSLALVCLDVVEPNLYSTLRLRALIRNDPDAGGKIEFGPLRAEHLVLSGSCPDDQLNRVSEPPVRMSFERSLELIQLLARVGWEMDSKYQRDLITHETALSVPFWYLSPGRSRVRSRQVPDFLGAPSETRTPDPLIKRRIDEQDSNQKETKGSNWIEIFSGASWRFQAAS